MIGDILYTIVSLAFVIALLYFTVFLLKKLQDKQVLLSNKLNKNSPKQKISIQETKYIDGKNKLVLVNCENNSYLLLLSDKNSLVIDEIHHIKKEDKN
jgi:flagellar biogenesis protein FliO